MARFAWQGLKGKFCMVGFAGSAIAQHAGRLDNFDEWRPGTAKTKWLLLAGANDPPKEVEISEGRSRDADKSGSFLQGVTKDLVTMESSPVVKRSLHNVVRDYTLEKEEARTKIKKFFSTCKQQERKPVLFYTGHGQVGINHT